MPRRKMQIDVEFPRDVEFVLKALAERDGVSIEKKAVQLMRMVLEEEEDRVLSAIAMERDKDGRKFISHEEAWGL